MLNTLETLLHLTHQDWRRSGNTSAIISSTLIHWSFKKLKAWLRKKSKNWSLNYLKLNSIKMNKKSSSLLSVSFCKEASSVKWVMSMKHLNSLVSIEHWLTQLKLDQEIQNVSLLTSMIRLKLNLRNNNRTEKIFKSSLSTSTKSAKLLLAQVKLSRKNYLVSKERRHNCLVDKMSS